MEWTKTQDENGIHFRDEADGKICLTIMGATPEALALVEAAPELLELIESVRTWRGSTNPATGQSAGMFTSMPLIEWIDRARVAIAKAKASK